MDRHKVDEADHVSPIVLVLERAVDVVMCSDYIDKFRSIRVTKMWHLHLRATKRKKGSVSTTVFLILLYRVANEQTVHVRKKQRTTNEKRILSNRQLT